MMCDISTPGGCSEVCDGPQHVQLARHGAEDSDRLVNEQGHVDDDEDREHELQRAGKAWALPEKRERKGTEDEEEQDHDPPRAVVPVERGARLSGAHDAHSARPDVNTPEEDNDQ